jgi:hypothetical protein
VKYLSRNAARKRPTTYSPVLPVSSTPTPVDLPYANTMNCDHPVDCAVAFTIVNTAAGAEERFVRVCLETGDFRRAKQQTP